jgi:hypothetical protein
VRRPADRAGAQEADAIARHDGRAGGGRREGYEECDADGCAHMVRGRRPTADIAERLSRIPPRSWQRECVDIILGAAARRGGEPTTGWSASTGRGLWTRPRSSSAVTSYVLLVVSCHTVRVRRAPTHQAEEGGSHAYRRRAGRYSRHARPTSGCMTVVPHVARRRNVSAASACPPTCRPGYLHDSCRTAGKHGTKRSSGFTSVTEVNPPLA